MNRLSWSVFIVVSGLAVLVCWPRPVPAVVIEEASDNSPRLLVHLLDYLAVDYGGAVQNGKILSNPEYAEQLEFARNAAELSSTLPEINSSLEIQGLIHKLSDLIQSKSDSTEVAEVARKAQTKVIELVHLAVSPVDWPSLSNGRVLFEKTCAQCHGREGRGDGPSAANLATKPINFRDPAKMREIAPFQVFNTIRLGVPKTPMPSFPHYSDRDTWSLAFYVVSLRYQNVATNGDMNPAFETAQTTLKLSQSELLIAAATNADARIEKDLSGTTADRDEILASIRLHSAAQSAHASLDFAASQLEDARADYQVGRFEGASKKALSAYTEGVEPVEPQLRSIDPEALSDLEQSMALVRTDIRNRKSAAELGTSIQRAEDILARSADLLSEKRSSPALTFTLSFGILLREGFEATLIIVALLGVIRASGARGANRWVHAGWLLALGLGCIAWIVSGWLTRNWSGTGRELMEGVTGLLTVLILLYLGFWLHSKTEISRWTKFINVQVRSAVDQRNYLQLALISFLAAFREAIETVLFLRAVWLEGASGTKAALAAGTAAALALIFALGWLLTTFSVRLPIRTLFNFSSVLMVALSVILTGKALHALQEIDLISASASYLNVHWNWLGLYPTRETLLAQLIILSVSLFLWMYGKRAPALV